MTIGVGVVGLCGKILRRRLRRRWTAACCATAAARRLVPPPATDVTNLFLPSPLPLKPEQIAVEDLIAKKSVTLELGSPPLPKKCLRQRWKVRGDRGGRKVIPRNRRSGRRTRLRNGEFARWTGWVLAEGRWLQLPSAEDCDCFYIRFET